MFGRCAVRLRQIFKTDPNDAIKSGGVQFTAGRRWAFRDVLLAAQIALCCVTVTAAFVSLRGLQKSLTKHSDSGIRPVEEHPACADPVSSPGGRDCSRRVWRVWTPALDRRHIRFASYTVSKRLRELSIRLALGAQARTILSVALGRMLVLLGIGALVGITLGVAASRLLSAIVYQASAQDPFVLAAVAFTTVLTGLISVAGPVRRVLHVDPATLLREQ